MKPSYEHPAKPALRPPELLDHSGRGHLIKFVRHVCPAADPTSILLFGQLMRAHGLLEQAAERNLASVGLSYAKFRLLMNLQRGEEAGAAEGMQPSELSDVQGVSRNTVSALIASLEKEGMLTREIHGTDHRRFVIRLTPEGRKLLKSKMSSQFKFVSECFRELDPAERKALLEHLLRLNKSLEEGKAIRE